MSLFNHLLKQIRSGIFSSAELRQLADAIKEKYPEIFDQTFIRIGTDRLAPNLNSPIPLKQHQYNFGSTLDAKLHRHRKFNRIAVVIIGEWRTGSIVSKYTKEFFSNLSCNVDYFIVSYNNVDEQTIKDSYSDAKIRLINSTGIKNVFFSRASLSQFGLKLIADKLDLYHNKVNYINLTKMQLYYEQIIETRPDLFLKSKIQNEPIPFCDYNQFTGASIQQILLTNEQETAEDIDVNLLDKNKLPRTLFIGDSYFRMHSLGYCRYANRIDYDYGIPNKFIHHYKYLNNVHGMTAEFLIKNDFVNIGSDYQFETVIRNPDMINYDLDSMTFEEIQKLNDKNHLR